MIRWIAAAALVLACSTTVDAQVSCMKLGDGMRQCSDGSWSMDFGDGFTMITPAPAPAPVVPSLETLEQAFPSNAYLPGDLLKPSELVAAWHRARQDCFNQRQPNTCDRQPSIERSLAAKGMCYGRPGQVKADWDWHLCGR